MEMRGFAVGKIYAYHCGAAIHRFSVLYTMEVFGFVDGIDKINRIE